MKEEVAERPNMEEEVAEKPDNEEEVAEEGCLGDGQLVRVVG